MWEAPPLPYYCDASALPAPLPTTLDIQSATCTLSEGASRVVKGRKLFCRQIWPQEKPSNPGRTKHDFRLSKPQNALTTGERLNDLWPRLPANERLIMLTNLRDIFNEMRSLPPLSSPFYGNICHGPLPYFLFWTPEAQPSINGPFAAEEELYLALVEKLRQIHTDSNQHSARVDWFKKHLPTSLTGHPPTFTHGDVRKKNIIVTQTCLQNGDVSSFKLMLIDWEDAAWYPDYFEYFSCYTSFIWDNDWPEMVEGFLDPYPVETLLMLPIYHEILF